MTNTLHEFLEQVYAHVDTRTKRAVLQVIFSAIGWEQNHINAFEACKRAVIHCTTLARCDETKRFCIYTEASDFYWSGIVTQIQRDQLSCPHADKYYESLAFQSSCFLKTQLRWSTLGKETFAVTPYTERSHWLTFSANSFALSTDYNNLCFIFDPLAAMPDIGQAIRCKVLRWAVRLLLYNYVCLHISCDDNVWSDLMSRWTISIITHRLVADLRLSSTFVDFEWPTVSFIRAPQEKKEHHPETACESKGLWQPPFSSLWISDLHGKLQLRVCAFVRTGATGHRSAAATKAIVFCEFSWSTMSEDVDPFAFSGIHCHSTKRERKVLCFFCSELFDTKPKNLVQCDYTEPGPNRTDETYILLVRGDHSDYSWFYAEW